MVTVSAKVFPADLPQPHQKKGAIRETGLNKLDLALRLRSF